MQVRNLVAGMTVALAALSITACGGGSDNETTVGDLDALEACITESFSAESGSPAEAGEADIIAGSAGVGSFNVATETQELNIAAERSTGDAENAVQTYEGFPMGEVTQIGTVVAAYNKTPTDEETAAVEDCLDEQGVG